MDINQTLKKNVCLLQVNSVKHVKVNQWPNIKDLPYILFFILPFLIHFCNSLEFVLFYLGKFKALEPSIQCDLFVLLKNQISFASKQNSYSKYYTAAPCSEKQLTAGFPSKCKAISNAEKTEKQLEEKCKKQNKMSLSLVYFDLLMSSIQKKWKQKQINKKAVLITGC